MYNYTGLEKKYWSDHHVLAAVQATSCPCAAETDLFDCLLFILDSQYSLTFCSPLFLSFSISLLPRLIAVEDELRGGPIVEPKPRIFPDQVCEPTAAFLVCCLCCSHCLSSLPPCFDFVSVCSDCTWSVSVFLFPSIPYDGDYLLPSLLIWPICYYKNKKTFCWKHTLYGSLSSSRESTGLL